MFKKLLYVRFWVGYWGDGDEKDLVCVFKGEKYRCVVEFYSRVFCSKVVDVRDVGWRGIILFGIWVLEDV